MALLGGLAVPLHRLGVILRHALAVGVHETQAGLRRGMALLGQRTKFPQGSREITALQRCHPDLEVHRLGRHEQDENE